MRIELSGLSDELMKVDIKTLEPSKCDEVEGGLFKQSINTTLQICAGQPVDANNKNPKDACFVILN